MADAHTNLDERSDPIVEEINRATPSQELAVVRSQQRTSNSNSSWLWKAGVAGLAAISSITGFALAPFSSSSTIPQHDYVARTKDVLSKVPLIDGHNDLPYLIRSELKHQIYNDRFTFNTGLLSNTDRKKLTEGMLGGQFWSSYIHCPDERHPIGLDDPTVRILPLGCGFILTISQWVVRDTLEQIDITKRFVDEFPDLFQYCDNSTCARRAFRNGKIGSYIGIEV